MTRTVIDGRTVARVYVDLEGTIYLDAAPVTIEELKSAFADLAADGGAVQYSATTRATERIEATVQVLDAIIEYRLPVALLEESPHGPGWPEVAFSGG